MFRLGYKISRLHSTLNNSSPKLFRRECPFCKNAIFYSPSLNPQVIYHNSYFFGRFLTTRARPQVTVKRKSKKKTTFQKYVELIQISEKHTKESLEVKAKLKKSTADNTLKQFGVSTSILRKNVDSKNLEQGKIKKDKTSEIIDSRLNPKVELQHGKVKSETEKPISLITKKLTDEEIRKLEKRIRKQKSLLPFIDVCGYTNKLNLAFSSLISYHDKFQSNGSIPNDVKLYNSLLESLAAKGNYNQLCRIINIMLSANMKPNLQSYAYALECAYRAKAFDKIEIILQKIKSHDLNVDNLLLECKFVKDQRDVVLKAIRLQINDFNPIKPEIPCHYICDLLKKLNENRPEDRFNSPLGPELSKLDFQQLTNQQIKIEKDGFKKVQRIDNMSAPDQKTKAYRKKLDDCESAWKSTMLNSFKNKLSQLSFEAERKRNRKTDLYPFLLSLKPEEFADLMFREFVAIAQFSETFSPMMVVLHNNLGTKVMEKYNVNKKINNGVYEQTMKIYEAYCKYMADPNLTSQYTSREYWTKLKEKYTDGPDIDVPDIIWPPSVRIGIGQFLFEIIQKDVKFDLNVLKNKNNEKNLVSAFYTVYRNHDVVKQREEIKPHPGLSKLYRLAKREHLIFDANFLPMVCPPVPWTSIQSGGYILTPTQLIRQPGMQINHQLDRLNQTNIQNVYPCLDSLTAVGEVPWIINKSVFDVVINVFLNKGSEELDIPQPSSECPPIPKINIKMSNLEVAKTLLERRELKQRKDEMFSLWCEMLYKLSIANEFRDKILWFPHNIDFRGRAYPCPPHLSHLGNDVSRSILLFAKGEPLGEKGLDWLKIHLINLTGLKKRCSMQERLDYCNGIIPEILDSADKPLTGNGWWKKSDEPWQTLATCMEVAKVLRSPDPTSYICHFPVHQDGSCNGLQHYAALGRDIEGAEQVNLRPSNKPQDVYSGIAEMVEEERKKDAASGLKIAKKLERHIFRRVVKQPVMTTVYGVTQYGARHQVVRQLEEIPNFPKEYMFQAAGYLVSKIFRCLQTMFTATKEIQGWFTKSANLITHSKKQPVEWVTPIGFPVVQPYFKIKPIYAEIRKKKILIRTEEIPDTRKQTNAFPPNYIHSLDSSHMMLTALFCQRKGVTFVSVHDCFWTHPNNVEEMNRICREQFVALHNEPLLQLLSEFLVKTYCSGEDLIHMDKNSMQQFYELYRLLSTVPRKGLFDLNEVLKSTYFFS